MNDLIFSIYGIKLSGKDDKLDKYFWNIMETLDWQNTNIIISGSYDNKVYIDHKISAEIDKITLDPSGLELYFTTGAALILKNRV